MDLLWSLRQDQWGVQDLPHFPVDDGRWYVLLAGWPVLVPHPENPVNPFTRKRTLSPEFFEKGRAGDFFPALKSHAEGYRYGFQGQEADDELFGADNGLDFGARVYDSRIGRWLSIDPMAGKYPSESPYSFCLDNPISFTDPGGDTVRIHVTRQNVGTTKINLFSSNELSSTLTQEKKIVPVFKVEVTNESGSSAVFYFTRIAYRKDKDNPTAEAVDVTFDVRNDGDMFLAVIKSRWSGTDNVLELRAFDDINSQYIEVQKAGIDETRQAIQFHIKGASDGCLLCVGSGQFESVVEGITIDESDLAANSGDSQTNFMNKIKSFRTEDENAGLSGIIAVQFEKENTPVSASPPSVQNPSVDSFSIPAYPTSYPTSDYNPTQILAPIGGN